jgi:lipoprotein-anchoring transpeptidase ErfK/SrfK
MRSRLLGLGALLTLGGTAAVLGVAGSPSGNSDARAAGPVVVTPAELVPKPSPVPAVQSEHSTQAALSIGIGARLRAQPVPRCDAEAVAGATAKGSYAIVVQRPTDAYASPGGSRSVGRFDRLDENGFPSVFGVVGVRLNSACRPSWYEAQLPVLPNGTTGWIRASAVSSYRVATRIVVNLGSRRLVAYRNGVPVLRATIGIGAPQTPTPTGRYFVDERYRLTDPNGPFGVAALGISAHSTVLYDWAEHGPIALHGTNDPSSIGAAASHGCVHVPNVDMRRLLQFAPAGTPVVIRA